MLNHFHCYDLFTLGGGGLRRPPRRHGLRRVIRVLLLRRGVALGILRFLNGQVISITAKNVGATLFVLVEPDLDGLRCGGSLLDVLRLLRLRRRRLRPLLVLFLAFFGALIIVLV